VIKLRFVKEKLTKNTVRFKEQPNAGEPPKVGVLYLQQWAVAGEVRYLTVTIEEE